MSNGFFFVTVATQTEVTITSLPGTVINEKSFFGLVLTYF